MRHTIRELRKRGAGATRPLGSDCAVAVWRWTIISLLAALAMPAAVQLGYAAEPPASQSEALSEVRAIEEETLDVANRLVRKFPRDSMAVGLLAAVHNSQGNTTEAVVSWNRCLKLNPRWANPYNCLATTALQRGDNDEAIALWRKAIQIDPRMEIAYDRMAKALMRAGKAQEVIELLKKHLAINKQAALSHYWLGQAYLQLKEYEKAEEHYRVTTALKPEFSPAYYGLLKVASLQGDTQAAAEYGKEFARHKTEYLENRHQELVIEDDTQALREVLARTYTDAGLVYHNHGYMWQAEKHWKKAATVDPENTVCRERLAMFYEKQKPSQQKALEMLRELTELHPERDRYYVHIGVIHARLKQFDDAEKAFRKACEFAPENSNGYSSLVQLYLQDGRQLPDITTLAEKVVQLKPTAPNYYFLSSVYQKNNQPDKARSAIGRALELDPDNPQYGKMQKLVQGKP